MAKCKKAQNCTVSCNLRWGGAPGGWAQVTWGGKKEKMRKGKIGNSSSSSSLWSKSHKEAGRCILLSRLFPDSWIRSFLTASNASLSPLFGDAQNPSSPWSQCKDKPENFMHQICFHKSEFATELKKLTNTLKPFFYFKKLSKKAWQQRNRQWKL